MTPDPRVVLDRPAPPPDVTVAYGQHPDQVVDIRLARRVGDPPGPAGDLPGTAGERGGPAGDPLPLVVVVHGGFWRSEWDRSHLGPLSADLAALGWPVATIEFRRTGVPGGGWPGTFDDVAEAIRRTPDLVAAAATDRDHPPPTGTPVLLGHSAGGQLALWYAATAPDTVHGVLALAPIANLAEAYALDLDHGAVAALLGSGPDTVPDRYAHADPRARLPLPVPTVVVHGDRDAHVPTALSREFVAAARESGSPVRLLELPGVEHFGLIDPLSTAWGPVTSALRSLCQRSLTIDAPSSTG